MSVQRLLEQLKQQKANLQNLLKNAKDKQSALVGNNNELLDNVIKNEQKLILAVQNSEKNRLQTITQLNSENGFEEREYRLNKLIENLEGVLSLEAKEAILKSEKSIRGFIDEITQVNNQNMFLIQHSKQFIDSTLKAVFGNNNKKSIFDRKV